MPNPHGHVPLGTPTRSTENIVNKTLSVPSISCNHCKQSIEAAVRPLAGVTRVEVDIAKKTVDVEFDAGETSVEHIAGAIAEQGYDVVGP